MKSSSGGVEDKFRDFYEKWVSQLEDYLHFLLKASNKSNNNNNNNNNNKTTTTTTTTCCSPKEYHDDNVLVAKLTAHHKEYYTAKWAAAHDDVFAFFSPVWLNPLENAYLWITGWKPSTVFHLLTAADGDQFRKIEELRVKIRSEEEKVEREMERLQVGIADRRMFELAKAKAKAAGSNNNNNNEKEIDGLVEVAVKGISGGLERVVKMADCVRLKTLKGVLDVLSPAQCVEFLASTSMLQIQLRQLGRRDIR